MLMKLILWLVTKIVEILYLPNNCQNNWFWWRLSSLACENEKCIFSMSAKLAASCKLSIASCNSILNWQLAANFTTVCQFDYVWTTLEFSHHNYVSLIIKWRTVCRWKLDCKRLILVATNSNSPLPNWQLSVVCQIQQFRRLQFDLQFAFSGSSELPADK